MKSRGFTLLEITIVLIIIGLFIAGISKASDLIKAAQLQSMIIQANEMIVAYNTFENVYNAVPGDFSSASAIFPNCAQTATNCNGDGDGNIEWVGSVNDEVYKAMLHMNRAGLIDNIIPDLPDSHVGDMLGVAVNTKRDAALFYGGFIPPISGVRIASGQEPAFRFEIAVYLGVYNVSKNYTFAAVSAPEAYNIDKKTDDGFYDGSRYKGYDSGKFRADHDGSGTINCFIGASYNIGDEDSNCLLGFAVN